MLSWKSISTVTHEENHSKRLVLSKVTDTAVDTEVSLSEVWKELGDCQNRSKLNK